MKIFIQLFLLVIVSMADVARADFVLKDEDFDFLAEEVLGAGTSCYCDFAKYNDPRNPLSVTGQRTDNPNVSATGTFMSVLPGAPGPNNKTVSNECNDCKNKSDCGQKTCIFKIKLNDGTVATITVNNLCKAKP